MHFTQLIELATTLRGQGWLGAMQIIDVLDDVDIQMENAKEIRQRMESVIGQQILSGAIGCDESALTHACNQSIEDLIGAGQMNCQSTNQTI